MEDIYDAEDLLERDAKNREQVARQKFDDLRSVLSTVEGRRFIWTLLGECGIFRSSYTDSVDRTIYMEGHRQTGLNLLKQIEVACPDRFIQMMQEHFGKGLDAPLKV